MGNIVSTLKKRKNRQDCLTGDQVKKITGKLGDSDSTGRFLSSIDSLLESYANENSILRDDFVISTYKELRKISNLAKELAEFLEQKPLERESKLTKPNIAENALSILISSLDDEQLLGKDRNVQKDYLQDLPQKLRRLESAINHDAYVGYLITLFDPKKKPPDFELDWFTAEVICAFQINMKRIPIISENSSDFEAMIIIYQAFDYHAEDSLIKRIKKACKERRAQLGLEGKYKVDFGEESNS